MTDKELAERSLHGQLLLAIWFGCRLEGQAFQTWERLRKKYGGPEVKEAVPA